MPKSPNLVRLHIRLSESARKRADAARGTESMSSLMRAAIRAQIQKERKVPNARPNGKIQHRQPFVEQAVDLPDEVHVLIPEDDRDNAAKAAARRGAEVGDWYRNALDVHLRTLRAQLHPRRHRARAAA